MTVADINVRTWLSLGFETLKKKKVAILMDGTASSSPNALADIPYSRGLGGSSEQVNGRYVQS